MVTVHPALPRLSGRDLVRNLFEIGAAIYLEDEVLTWASGIEAPFYCDNRLTNSDVRLRGQITDRFAEHIVTQDWRPEAIVGTATAGIAQAALLAHRFQLPMAYVRPKSKSHGRGRRMEGSITPGQRVVVVEDLVSTGRSSLRVVDTLRDMCGLEVIGIVAIFTYSFRGVAERFSEKGVDLFTIIDFPKLLAVATEEGILPSLALQDLDRWHQDPGAWALARQQ